MFEIIQRLKDKTGLAFYLRPQTYEVSAEVILTNTTGGSKDFALVVPLFRDGFGQKILHGPDIFPKPPLIKTDPVYDNPYVVFSGNAAFKESFIFRTSTKVAVESRRINSTQTFTLPDYNFLDKNILAKWTSSSPHIEIRDPRILPLATEAKRGASDVWSIIKNLNEYVISRLHYGNPILGLYSTNEVLEKDTVDCGGFDVLFIALCRVLGIPARLVSGFWAGYRDNSMHAWVEVLLPNGQWVPVDPSMEQLARAGRTTKGGRVGFAGSDRLVASYGADITIEANDKTVTVPLLQNPALAFETMNKYFSISFKLETKRL